MHQGPDANSSSIVCCADVSAIAKCFFTRGGSLFVTGLAEINPHRIARMNALETTPAIFRTVFALMGRWLLCLRAWPPHCSSRVHSRLRWSGVISPIGMVNSAGSRYAACSW